MATAGAGAPPAGGEARFWAWESYRGRREASPPGAGLEARIDMRADSRAAQPARSSASAAQQAPVAITRVMGQSSLPSPPEQRRVTEGESRGSYSGIRILGAQGFCNRGG